MKIREKLKNLYQNGTTKGRFVGTFTRVGNKSKKKLMVCGGCDEVALVNDIKTDEGAEVADHVWFDLDDKFTDIQINDTIVFDADIHRYLKGFVDRKNMIDRRYTNYTLINVKNIEKVDND